MRCSSFVSILVIVIFGFSGVCSPAAFALARASAFSFINLCYSCSYSANESSRGGAAFFGFSAAFFLASSLAIRFSCIIFCWCYSCSARVIYSTGLAGLLPPPSAPLFAFSSAFLRIFSYYSFSCSSIDLTGYCGVLGTGGAGLAGPRPRPGRAPPPRAGGGLGPPRGGGGLGPPLLGGGGRTVGAGAGGLRGAPGPGAGGAGGLGGPPPPAAC